MSVGLCELVFAEDAVTIHHVEVEFRRIDYKRANEIDPIRLRPHPHEFELYYDI